MKAKRIFTAGWWLLMCLALGGVTFGQIKSGTITGTVTDSAGAVVPGAEVTITDEETNFTTTATTNDAGEFTAPYLAAGRYSVTVKKGGFATTKKTGIPLGTAQAVRADVTLQAGQVESTVEVTADAAQLQTESATVQSAVNETTIKAVPNINHNPLYYAALQPGVVGRASFNDTTNINSFGIGVDGRRFFSAISVNGAQAFSADVQVDGLSVQGSAWNEAAIIPNQEGLQEVKTITNSYSAEYGRGSGIVQLATKSGTNQYHGSAVYRARNEAFNANTFENNTRGIRRAPFKVHSYTGSLGGPVWIPKLVNGRDKLFFFVSYEGLKHSRALDYFRTVPTEAERVGDFSQTRVLVNGVPTPLQIYNPYSARSIGNNRFQRDLIPNADLRNVPNLVDPNILRLFSYYPKPNRTPDDAIGTNNYYARRRQQFSRDSVNARVDYKLGAHSVYSAFGLNRGSITTPGAWGEDNPFYNQFQFIGEQNADDNPYGQIGWTIVFNPRLVADVRYGVTRIFSINKAYPGTERFNYDQFGIPANIQAIIAVPNAAPEFGPGGNLAPLSRTGSLYKEEGQTNHNLNWSVTAQHGRWTFKAGSEYRVYLSNYDDPENAVNIITRQDFTREYVDTFGNGVNVTPVTPANSGWGPASALLGAGRLQVNGARNPKPAFAQKYLAFFSQNDWRATDRLNVYFGLRYDIQPGLTDRFNRVRSIDLTQRNAFGMLGTWVFPGYDGVARNLYETEYDNFGPRAGFAYRLTENTVIRAGYGLTYLPSNTGFFATGGFYGLDAFAFSTNNDNAIAYGTNPQGRPVGRFNQVNVIIPPLGANPAAPEFYGVSNFAYFPHKGYQNANLQQWNLTAERRFGKNWLSSVAYVGSKGSHLPVSRVPLNSNQFVDAAVLADCRRDYIARNGTGMRCNDPVRNPFQPASGPLINFGGNLRNATIPFIQTVQPYPAIAGSGVVGTFGWSNYHSLQASVSRSFARGLQFNANYVWSKTLGLDASEAQSNGFADGGFGYNAGGLDLRNRRAAPLRRVVRV
jgi:trimeric autotransporter adhesin